MVECTDPDQLMSPPRRLENMRNAGQNILNQQNVNEEYESRGARRAKEYAKSAAKFAKKQGPDLEDIQSWASRMQQISSKKP